jgi:predicted nucleic acid-binding Zn ribbon protein
MRPGETFRFRTRVLDAAGCWVDVTPTFRLESPDSPARLLRSGEVRIHDTAPEGEVALIALVSGRRLRVVVEVVSTARYAALLESERFTKEGESKEAAVSASASSSVGTRAAVAQERARSRRTTFVAIVGAAALILGVLGLILVARSRKQARTPAAIAAPELERGTPPAAARIGGTICPTCREEYPAEAQFCPLDGNRLTSIIPDGETRGPAGGVCPVCGQGFDPGVTSCPKHDEELVPVAAYRAPLAQAPEPAKVCPMCGTQYPGDGRFCGRDGAALVAMN